MPTLSTVPSSEEELMEPTSLSVNSAFTVLNSSDNLKTYSKPNAIVRPSIRLNPPNGEDFILKNVESQILLDGDDDDGKLHYDLGSFTKELDIKLRRLQRDKKCSSKNSSNGDTIQKRPLFITTVPTGIFLQPSRELPVPPPRRTYAYFSIPKILANSNDNASGIQTTPPKMPFKKSRQREMPPQNIMHDKRIFRGSNFSQPHNNWNPYFAYAGLLSGKTETDAINKEQEARRRQLLRKRNIEHQRSQRGVIGTPPPVKGRRHENVQTDKYLEQLLCRPIESDAQCQTDLFLHRPPTPPYVATVNKGVDVETEIFEGELFDFDNEVKSILEKLVGQTVEQSLLEVLNEEEFAEIHKQQQEHLTIRECEIADLKRLQNKENRLYEEKNRRIHQEKISKELEQEMQEKITAAKLLQGYIADLLPGVLQAIEPFLETENREALECTLSPWLSQEVAEEVGRMVDSQDLLEELVREILEDRAAKYLQMSENEEKEVETKEQTD